MSIRQTLAGVVHRALEITRSERGHDVWLYLVFVVIAAVFWALLSLDNEVQRDIDLPVELQEMPDSVTVISGLPPSISISIKGKGSQMLRFWGADPGPLKFKFESHGLKGNRYIISPQRLESRMRDYFGSGITVVSMRPDSIAAIFTRRPGQRVRLAVDAAVQPDLQSVISGPVTASVDSVTVYSTDGIPASLTSVTTEPVVRTGLHDTTTIEVRVTPLPGMRIEPATVKVTIPVEPLIAKKQTVAVEILNEPSDANVILFPSKVEVSYLVPMSQYNDLHPMQAFADYRAISSGASKLAVILTSPHGKMQNLSISTDSVEYVVERR